MLKTYKEFLEERNIFESDSPGVLRLAGILAKKFGSVPIRIIKQLARYKKRKEDIKKMIQQAETPKEKAKLKKQLMLINDKEFEAKKKAKAAQAAAKAKKG